MLSHWTLSINGTRRRSYFGRRSRKCGRLRVSLRLRSLQPSFHRECHPTAKSCLASALLLLHGQIHVLRAVLPGVGTLETGKKAGKNEEGKGGWWRERKFHFFVYYLIIFF